MPSRNSGLRAVLLLLLLGIASCSTTKRGEPRDSRSATLAGQTSSGAIVGTVQLALRSGDVKSLAFTTVRLTQQQYAVLSEAEKEEIAWDVNQGLEAAKYDLISMDEVNRKTKARAQAMESFQKRLPEKESIPSVAATTTDANGAFKFAKIQPGTYWLFLDTLVGSNFVGWAVKVEVKADTTTKADLNNTNVDYAFR